jgi:uncharacterized protein YggE
VNAGLIASSTIAMIFLMAAALSLSVFYDHGAYAQNTIQNVSNASSNSTLSVVGNAQTMVKPDKVTLSLAIETTNTTANAALNANSEAMNKALNELEAAGVRENETTTSFFNISPNYNLTQQGQEQDSPSPIESRDIISYTVTNSIIVDSYNLLNISKWIDTAVLVGVNDVSNIYFSLSAAKSEAIKNDLLKQAVTSAKGKAEIAASALGLNLTGVKSINIESINGFPPPEPLMARETVAEATAPTAGSPTPIIAGEQEVTASVHIVFLIGQYRSFK